MPRRLQLFLRALTLRCPNCGKRGLFRHWLAMREACPNCGLSLATGNRVGAYLLNLVAAELVLMAAIVVIVLRSWPHPPWDLLQYLAPALMVIAPLLLYPFSKMVFVAIDLAMYPRALPDAAAHGINEPPA
ncbi:MAG TPA: DUF983 domain-containing protein [Gemmatimonadales bacterium]|jgi:uncharacterized protein (DUF983 family)|nr:DUF983 domain-containing protein [Gemmatimonadales bacterium]